MYYGLGRIGTNLVAFLKCTLEDGSIPKGNVHYLTVILPPKAPKRLPTKAPFMANIPRKEASPPRPTPPISPPIAPATTGAAKPPVIPMTAAPATEARPTFHLLEEAFWAWRFLVSASAVRAFDARISVLAMSVSSLVKTVRGMAKADVR